MSNELYCNRFLFGEPLDYLKRPLLKIQPILAREGKPSVDIAQLAEMLKGVATVGEMIRIQSPEHWINCVESLGEDIGAILPVSSPCYPTEIWNSCPQPLVKRNLPVLFWALIEYDEADFWKWSARDFLRALGVEVHLIKSNAHGISLLKALAMRKFLAKGKIIVFGEQNFPWNAHAAKHFIKNSLGTEIVVKTISAIRERMGSFSDARLDQLWNERKSRYHIMSSSASVSIFLGSTSRRTSNPPPWNQGVHPLGIIDCRFLSGTWASLPSLSCKHVPPLRTA